MTVSPQAQGPFVEITHPLTGNTFSVDVVGEIQVTPSANGLPRVEIPVRRNERWESGDYEDASIDVYIDGQPQPIDEIETVRFSEGQAILSGRGGLELDTRVEAEYDVKEIHKAWAALVTNNTTYTENVDTPTATTVTNELVQEADTSTDFTDLLIAPSDDQPLVVDGNNNRVETTQTLGFDEGENNDGGTLAGGTTSGSKFSEGEAASVASRTDDPQYDFTFEHDIPGDKWDVDLRLEADGSTSSAFDVLVDGTRIGDLGKGAVPENITWITFFGESTELTSGSHTVTIDVTSANDSVFIDVVTLYDNRFSYNFDNSTDSDNHLAGPETHPNATNNLTRVEFNDAVVGDSVTGGRIEATSNDSKLAKVELSNDEGATFPLSDTDTDTFEGDFGNKGPALRWSVTTERFGSRTTDSPTEGFKGQTIESFDLKADLNDTPLVVDQTYDMSLDEIFDDLAQQGNFIWEVRYQRDGTVSVEVTQPGQRTGNPDLDIVSYETTRTTANVVEELTIKGETRQISDESVTADHGTAVTLAEGDLVETSEIVTDGSGTVYERGVDYEMTTSSSNGYLDGEITTKSGGNITDGESLEVDYRYRISQSDKVSGAGNDPVSRSITIRGLTTRRACGLVASQILDSVKDPRYEVTVTIPTSSTARVNVVEAIDPDEIPYSQDLEVLEVETQPGVAVLQLGSRSGFGETVDDIRSDIQAISHYS